MAQSILLAYKGTDNGTYFRSLIGTLGSSYVCIEPTTKLLGASFGTGFLSSGFVIADATMYVIGMTTSGPTLSLFVNGNRVFTHTRTDPIPDITRIGNSGVMPTTAALVPSSALKPSATLKPSAPGYSKQSYANGMIDEVQRYDIALTDAEMQRYSAQLSLYAALPSLPLQDGFSEQQGSGVIVSSIDGHRAARLRNTNVPTRYQMQFHLTREQTQILDYFYEVTTRHGTLPFKCVNPTTVTQTATMVARLIAPPSYSYKGHEYTASVQIESVPA